MTKETVEMSVAFIAAASAFVVAWVAGAFSLRGLLISKEQKVSEFRQAWIDALRADIAALVAHAYQIHAFAAGPRGSDYPEFLKATGDDYIELNKASMRIKLRINPDECDSKLILQSMTELEAFFGQLQSHSDRASLEELHKIVRALERDAPPLLKKEWQRVKDGEPIYRWAKGLALVVFVVAGVMAVTLFWTLLR